MTSPNTPAPVTTPRSDGLSFASAAVGAATVAILVFVALQVTGGVDLYDDADTAVTIAGLVAGVVAGSYVAERLRVSEHPRAETARTTICVLSALAVPFLLGLGAVIAFVEWSSPYQF